LLIIDNDQSVLHTETNVDQRNFLPSESNINSGSVKLKQGKNSYTIRSSLLEATTNPVLQQRRKTKVEKHNKQYLDTIPQITEPSPSPLKKVMPRNKSPSFANVEESSNTLSNSGFSLH